MTILFVDYLSYSGHRVFNRIQIDALLSLGYDMHLIGRKEFFAEYKGISNVKITSIPDRYYKKLPMTALSSRILMILSLFWIRNTFKCVKNDILIFSSYDIISLYFFRVVNSVYLINHNNVEQLQNSIKLFLTRHLPDNYKHIALNDNMQCRLKVLLPNRTICYVPHGVISPSQVLTKPTFIGYNEKFIFCPVNQNINNNLLSKIIDSVEFNNYLKEHNIVLYIKSNLGVTPRSDSVITIKSRLNDGEYNYMMKEALAVFLPYNSSDFQYRCSGIFFECVAFSSHIIASELPSMNMYKNNVDISYVADINSFVKAIEYSLNSNKHECDLSLFSPKNYWKKVLLESFD